MFRTSSFRNDIRFQQIISKELLNGFNQIFMIESKDTELIQSCFEIFCEEAGIEFGSSLEKDLLFYKMLGMYREIADPDQRYTFDEHGEWFLSKILLTAYERIEAQIESWYDFEEDEDQGEPTIDKLWISSLSEDEVQYVRKKAEEYCFNVSEEILWEMGEDTDEDYKKGVISEWEKNREDMVRRISYFPLMAEEITDDAEPEVLFWDRDFLFMDEFGPENFNILTKVLNQNGVDSGFSPVDEHTQLLTGSLAFGLTEED